ncbi:MAG: hypothetical protein ACYC9O_12705, partial [Candidatus Latescibacterota bacterium]
LPENLEQLLFGIIKIGISAYIGAAAIKMAQSDFKDIGLKDIFRRSLQGIQWFIRIAEHLGETAMKKFEHVKWRNDNMEIGIPNKEGMYLFVPKEYLDWYVQAPRLLLADLAEVVSAGRQLKIAVFHTDQVETVSITQKDRHVFYQKEEDGDIIFPELKHGQHVELEGSVTKGNENANSIGFNHREHILICYPSTGSIVRFKSALFLKCSISGTISRLDKFGGTNDPRPKIIFDNLVPLLEESNTPDLFDENPNYKSIEGNEE